MEAASGRETSQGWGQGRGGGPAPRQERWPQRHARTFPHLSWKRAPTSPSPAPLPTDEDREPSGGGRWTETELGGIGSHLATCALRDLGQVAFPV